MMKLKYLTVALCIGGLLAGCGSNGEPSADELSFDDSNGGLTLPDGFSAMIVADSLGNARHLAIAENGNMYVAMRRDSDPGGIAALRDTDGDGRMDKKEFFGDHRGTGIGIYDGYLYASSTTEVVRYKLGDALVPEGDAETIVSGFPDQSQHESKSFTFDDAGNIYVNVGAPSNSCQKQDRSKESPGMDPCPLLERHAGIWKFSATEPGQTQMDDGTRYATGLRNVVGLEWNSSTNSLWVAQHGRDMLYQSWPEYYTAEESAALPAETLYEVQEGQNFGWPYSYYDQRKQQIMLAPEYGGNGEKTLAGTKYEGKFQRPNAAYPGHWAPNALTFYTGTQFPEGYRGNAYIAFHGSWNRAPEPQQGYKVVMTPMQANSAGADFSEFADGFAGADQPQPGSAEHRPTGLTVGPNGSLYIADDTQGTIWRVAYTGRES